MFGRFGRAMLRSKALKGVTAFGSGLALSNFSTKFAQANDGGAHIPEYGWSNDGPFKVMDPASLRRGYEVYRNVCSTCHSLEILHFRELVGVTHTEEQAKALAASYTVKDGPDAEGNYFDRPGKLSDPFPQPYENEEFARFINGGAYPPDLTLITKGRDGGANYVFALMNGYDDPPFGESLREGLHWNSYFPGGAISMAKPLQDGGVEYEDGTEATVAQQSKDVAQFLMWTAEPEMDERKKMGMRAMLGFFMFAAASGWHKRFRYGPLKARKMASPFQ